MTDRDALRIIMLSPWFDRVIHYSIVREVCAGRATSNGFYCAEPVH